MNDRELPDVRLVERMLRERRLTEEELRRRLEELPDASHKVDPHYVPPRLEEFAYLRTAWRRLLRAHGVASLGERQEQEEQEEQEPCRSTSTSAGDVDEPSAP